MLAGRVAQHWLEAAVTRASGSNCSSSSSSSSSALPLEQLTALVAKLHDLQCSQVHLTRRRLSSTVGGGSSSSSSTSGSSADTGATSSAAGDSSSWAAAQAAGTQQPTQQSAYIKAAQFRTLPKRSSGTGYPETSLQATAVQQQQQGEAAGSTASNDSSSSSTEQLQRRQQHGEPPSDGVGLLPPEVLRVPLTQEAKQEQAAAAVDAYSFSRSLVGEAPPGNPQLGAAAAAAAAAAAEQRPGREPLTSADKEALEKLVGILTKDGKKSRARRLLLDAMHIIQQQLAQGKGSA